MTTRAARWTRASATRARRWTRAGSRCSPAHPAVARHSDRDGTTPASPGAPDPSRDQRARRQVGREWTAGSGWGKTAQRTASRGGRESAANRQRRGPNAGTRPGMGGGRNARRSASQCPMARGGAHTRARPRGASDREGRVGATWGSARVAGQVRVGTTELVAGARVGSDRARGRAGRERERQSAPEGPKRGRIRWHTPPRRTKRAGEGGDSSYRVGAGQWPELMGGARAGRVARRMRVGALQTAAGPVHGPRREDG